MATVYILTNIINDKQYIGKTIKKFNKRLSQHLKAARSGNGYCLHRAIRKYGIENFHIECLQVSNKLVNLWENHLIRRWNTLAPNGYNLTVGGEGGEHTEEVKQKIAKAHKGKSKTEEHIKNISKGKKGKKNPVLSEAMKGHIPWNIGIEHNKETRKKISEKAKGRPAHNRRKTVLIHPNGSTEVFNALTHAAKKYDLNHSGLVNVINGNIKTFKGFRVVYYNTWDGEPFKPYIGRKHSVPIILIHPDGTEELFNKIKDAENKYGFSHGHLSQVLNGTVKHAKGFKCKYNK